MKPPGRKRTHHPIHPLDGHNKLSKVAITQDRTRACRDLPTLSTEWNFGDRRYCKIRQYFDFRQEKLNRRKFLRRSLLSVNYLFRCYQWTKKEFSRQNLVAYRHLRDHLTVVLFRGRSRLQLLDHIYGLRVDSPFKVDSYQPQIHIDVSANVGPETNWLHSYMLDKDNSKGVFKISCYVRFFAGNDIEQKGT